MCIQVATLSGSVHFLYPNFDWPVHILIMSTIRAHAFIFDIHMYMSIEVSLLYTLECVRLLTSLACSVIECLFH